MVMEIWKYTLRVEDHQYVTWPRGSRPLYVAEQRGEIVLYAHVDAGENHAERREVWVHGTGHTTGFSAAAQPLGVVSLMEGALMFHVFIEPRED